MVEYGVGLLAIMVLIYLTGLIVGIYMIIFLYRNNVDFKRFMDKILVHPKFYLINRVIFLSSMYSYTLVFGELVKAGIPVSEALETAVDMVENLYIKENRDSMHIGRGFS